MKACILGATFNTNNMGVSMLAAGALRCVLSRYSNAQVIMLDYAQEGYDFTFVVDGVSVPVRFVNLRFSKKVYLPNNIAVLLLLAALMRVVPLARLRHALVKRNTYLKQILEADVFFSLSGGDSFSDIYGIGRFLYVILPQVLAVLAKKRLILLPQTIGPFKNRLVQRMATYIMTQAEVIYSRDHNGLEACRRVLQLEQHDPKVRFCYDLAFDVDPVRPSRVEVQGVDTIACGRQPVVGFNVSGLLLTGGYTHKNMFGLRVDYRDLVERMISCLIDEKDATVLLLPHVMGTHGESDVHACQEIYNTLRNRYHGRIGLIHGNYQYHEIKHIIGLTQFFVGARMHACIGALAQGVPTLPIAYSDKFRGMMQSIGFEDLVVDPRQLNTEEILDVLRQVYHHRDAIAARLVDTMPAIRKSIRRALDDIAIATH